MYTVKDKDGKEMILTSDGIRLYALCEAINSGGPVLKTIEDCINYLISMGFDIQSSPDDDMLIE